MNATFIVVALLVLFGLASTSDLPQLAKAWLAASAIGCLWLAGFAGGVHVQRLRSLRVLEQAATPTPAQNAIISEEQRSALERLNETAHRFTPLVGLATLLVGAVGAVISLAALFLD